MCVELCQSPYNLKESVCETLSREVVHMWIPGCAHVDTNKKPEQSPSNKRRLQFTTEKMNKRNTITEEGTIMYIE